MDVAQDEIDALLDRLRVTDDSGEINTIFDRLLEQTQEWGDAGIAVLEARWERVHAELDDAKLRSAVVNTKLATLLMAAGNPIAEEQTPRRIVTGPKPQRVLTAQHLLAYAHDVVPFDERTVTKSMDALPRPSWDDSAGVFTNATTLLRTAGYYVLDKNDAMAALASAPPEQETFPPLPFTRVWIEMAEHNRAVPYMTYNHDGKDRLEILGVGLSEVSQGTLWDVYLAFRFEDRNEFFFIGMRLAPDGLASKIDDEEGMALFGAAYPQLRALTVGGAHLITARNVPHEPVVLHRQQRRTMARLGQTLPRIYYVNIGASGEHDSDRHSGREYHVRWLVRGHWRHIDAGQRICTCCSPARIASWIDPYVKGPAGAPWKGRPVHRVIAKDGEEEE